MHQSQSHPLLPCGAGAGAGGGVPRRAASQIVRQGSRLPVSLPLSVCGPLLTRKKKEKGREGEERDRSTLPLEPFALKLAGECLRQSLHTEYVEPLSGLKKIYYCLPNGSSARNGCLLL